MSCGEWGSQCGCLRYKILERRNRNVANQARDVSYANMMYFPKPLPTSGAIAASAIRILASALGKMHKRKHDQICFDPEHCRCGDGWRGAAGAKSDPLVIDLNRDGNIDLVNGEYYFDLDANGFSELTRWISGSDGLLVIDRNGNGLIDDGSELFGDHFLKSDGTYATCGWDALADFDLNGDGVIDENDEVFHLLRVFTDVNGDDNFERDELLSLEEAGIKSIIISNLTDGVAVEGGTAGRAGTIVWADDTAGLIQEVYPDRTPMYSIANELLEIPEEMWDLPYIAGRGVLHSLHQAMVRDESGAIRSALEEYLAADRLSDKAPLLETLLFEWAGVANIDPNSRGGNIDARRLEFLEKYMGESFIGLEPGHGPIGYTSNPNPASAEILNDYFRNIVNEYRSFSFDTVDSPPIF